MQPARSFTELTKLKRSEPELPAAEQCGFISMNTFYRAYKKYSMPETNP